MKTEGEFIANTIIYKSNLYNFYIEFGLYNKSGWYELTKQIVIKSIAITEIQSKLFVDLEKHKEDFFANY